MSLVDSILLGKHPTLDSLVKRVGDALQAGRLWKGNGTDWLAAMDRNGQALKIAFRTRKGGTWRVKVSLKPGRPTALDLTPSGPYDPVAGLSENTDYVRVFRLPDGTVTTITGHVTIPETLPIARTDGLFSYWYYADTAATGNAELSAGAAVSQEGAAPIEPPIVATVESIVSASRAIKRVDHPILDITKAGLVGVVIDRDSQASNGTDTYAGGIDIVGWRVRYWVNLEV